MPVLSVGTMDIGEEPVLTVAVVEIATTPELPKAEPTVGASGLRTEGKDARVGFRLWFAHLIRTGK